MATRNYTWVAITILAVAVCFLAISQTGGWFKRNPIASAQPEFGIAKRGSFSILLTKKGEVESAENVDIKCLTSGVILDIIPENTRVKEGDLLIKLSSIDQEIAIESQNVVLAKTISDVILSESRLSETMVAREEYIQGTFPEKIYFLQREIAKAEKDIYLQREEEKLAKAEGKNELELTKLEMRMQEAEDNKEIAKKRLQVLETITIKKMRNKLESEIKLAQVILKAHQERFSAETYQLANYKKQLEACEIRMPEGVSGTVFYARNRKLLGPGSVISEGQSVFEIPNPSRMIVNLHVNEAEVVPLKTGMPARIRIVDETYQGRVTVANRLNRKKPSDDGFETYTTTVRIEGKLPKGIEPGMTAEVTIKGADVKDQVYLPKEAVLNYDGKRFCCVKTNENLYEPRELVIGHASEKFVEVTSGISEGEVYLLKPGDWMELIELPPADGPSIDDNFLNGIVGSENDETDRVGDGGLRAGGNRVPQDYSGGRGQRGAGGGGFRGGGGQRGGDGGENVEANK